MRASSLATNKQFSVEESTDFKSEGRNKIVWKKKKEHCDTLTLSNQVR